jgi:glycosyltransferase involved in cell wall biosynthesis
MPQPILSVLIAAYQAEKTIRRAIESALLQPDTEVVVAPDDGLQKYKHLETEYPGRLKVLEPSYRAGPGRSRNRAFDASSGAFITMLDCDDYFGAHALDEALALAHQSHRKIAFLRTVYIHDGTGVVCRQLPRSQVLSFEMFTNFHGSVHALYPRAMWQPYSDHRISQDVLLDANMLLASDGAAPMTNAPHFKTIHPASVTTGTDQAEINAEYACILENEAHPRIQKLFREKLRVGEHYHQIRSSGLHHSFHEFLRWRDIHQISAGDQ